MVLGEAKIGEFLKKKIHIFMKKLIISWKKNREIIEKNSAEERHEKITNKNERRRVSISSGRF